MCALTNERANFVKCHILPQAFTRPAAKGAALYQSTKGVGGRRRWTSWYDPALVTRTGEDLLSSIDDAAIKSLREHLLVWSSWVVFRPHFESFGPLMPNHGFREINGINAERLIAFALSVAWRASASSLPDLNDVKLDQETELALREYVLGKPIEGTSQFPVSLTQLSTLGQIHNQSPYLDEKEMFASQDDETTLCKIMRIYADGLIFHVHLDPLSKEHVDGNSLFLGASEKLLVPSVSYETSFQYENMLHVMRECHPTLVEGSI